MSHNLCACCLLTASNALAGFGGTLKVLWGEAKNDLDNSAGGMQ